MDKDKIKNDYRLTGGIHTVQIEVDGLLQNVPPAFRCADVVRRMTYDEDDDCPGLYTSQCIINVHKAGSSDAVIETLRDCGCTYDFDAAVKRRGSRDDKRDVDIYSYSAYRDIFDAILLAMDVDEYTVVRADFRHDSFDPNWYEDFYKLNLLLGYLIAAVNNVRNARVTNNLWTFRPESIYARNKYMELDIYNKLSASGGQDAAAARMEERTKAWLEAYTKDDDGSHIRDQDAIEITKDVFGTGSKWSQLWDNTLRGIKYTDSRGRAKVRGGYQSVQDRCNAELIRRWQQDQKRGEDRMYETYNQFVKFNQDRIFTRDQLTKLIEAIAPEKHAPSAANNCKDRYHMQFFSLADLGLVIAERNRSAEVFFST